MRQGPGVLAVAVVRQMLGILGEDVMAKELAVSYLEWDWQISTISLGLRRQCL
jgi:hypothetical protein